MLGTNTETLPTRSSDGKLWSVTGLIIYIFLTMSDPGRTGRIPRSA